MGNQAPAETNENVVGEVELALIAGVGSDGDPVAIQTESGLLNVQIISPSGAKLTDALAAVGDDEIRVDTSPSEPLDVSDAEVDIDLTSQSLSQLATNVEQIGGEAQSAVDVAGAIDQIQDALASAGTDELRVASPNPLDVSAAEIDVDLSSQSLTPLTVTDDGSLNVAGTVATEQQSPVQVEDSAGTNIDPAEATEYPNTQVSGEDIIANGDLVVGPVSAAKSSGVTIAANSTDGNAFSVSVEWTDSSGNIYQQESATDIQLSSVTQDFARLVRKAPQATVTVTDESGATQNNINIHVDAQR